MIPLTIEQLKALPVGDWVWVVFPTVPDLMESTYIRKSPSSDDSRLYDALDVDDEGKETFICYSSYGRTWLAYKNKEQAEAKGEIVKLPCNIGDPIWVVYRDFDHGFNEYKIYKATCVGFEFEHGTEIRIVTTFCCYDFDRVGNYTDESAAKRRLEELRGEK